MDYRIHTFFGASASQEATKPSKTSGDEAQGTGYAHNHARLNSCHSRASISHQQQLNFFENLSP